MLLLDPLDVLGQLGRTALGAQEGGGLTDEVGQSSIAAGEQHRDATGVGGRQVDDVRVAGGPQEGVGTPELHQLTAQPGDVSRRRGRSRRRSGHCVTLTTGRPRAREDTGRARSR